MDIKEFVKSYLEGGLNVLAGKNSENLFEMAKLCDKKRDGYGFYICVYGSEDPVHGRPEHLPIHAHVLAELRPAVLLGKIDMTNENAPNSHLDVKDADKEKILSADVKRKIVEWAKQKDDDIPGFNKWQVSRVMFKKLNPHLFNK